MEHNVSEQCNFDFLEGKNINGRKYTPFIAAFDDIYGKRGTIKLTT